MIVLTFCLHRAAHLSIEAFRDYWLNHHGPLVRRHLKALHAQRYVQLHRQDDAVGVALGKVRGAPEPYDGMAQIWWASRADLNVSMTEPAARAAGRELLDDERRFIDLSRSPIWINQAHVFQPDA